ncbi:hypothetical protein A5662_08105 [Mycobacteriaceae bacterium 1482268.1]|nr:hypothetical protein A5662_08105 [Mycobacteriaceae bacterium 1482268.1]
MVTVPAFVWRYGPILRGLILGAAVGGFLGALAWLDSGMLLGGLAAFVILFVFYGVWMARRTVRYWPSAKQLSGTERERVASAARSGVRIDDARLVPALVEYRDGLHESAENASPFRWVIPLVLVVSIASAVYDAVFGSWGNVIVSVIYVVLLLLEVFWWSKRQKQLLANADRAAEVSRNLESEVE